METEGVSSAIISAVQGRVRNQLKSVSKQPFDGVGIQTVEKEFFQILGKSGASGLTALFISNDETKKTLTFGGHKHYRKYISVGKYLTLLGEISLKRGIYQSNKEKQSICPLELKLKFINDYVSFAATEYICYNLATMSFSEFIKHCKKWSLMKPSQGTVKRVLDYVGIFLENNEFFTSIHSKENISKNAVTLSISMDSTSVLLKDSGWKQATAATVSEYDIEGERLNTIYIGRMPEDKKIKIKRLLEKEVEAKIKKYKFNQIVCIADGSRDLWKYFRKKYPKAVYVLDFYHVCEHLSNLSQLFFKNHSKVQAWYEKYKAILKEEPKGASKVIRAARYRRNIINKNPNIETEIKYLQRNRKKMNYYELQQKNLPIGSGVIEAACKNLIGARMKKSGMRWTIEGGQTILTLRSLILSDRWEKFWTYLLNRHFLQKGDNIKC